MTFDVIENLINKLSIYPLVMIESHGMSMYPTIADSDKIILQKSNSIKTDDIIVFYEQRNGYELIAHRVVAVIGEKYILTKGDNNKVCDFPVRRERVIAKVIKIVHEGGEVT